MNTYILLNDAELMVRFLNVIMVFNYIEFSYSYKILAETFKVTCLQFTFKRFIKHILAYSEKAHVP